MGMDVAGIDRSRALVECARSAFPDGDFAQADANEMALEPKADAVVANGVFLYFESLDYAAEVLALMAARATRAVAVLDVPDAARRDEALAYRQELVGGREAYEKRYEGLEHLSYDRDWFVQQMRDLGLRDIHVGDQQVAGYANARFRFNAWGFR
jgi:trans-aconitate methyltransferase